jgi:hypothetical protein
MQASKASLVATRAQMQAAAAQLPLLSTPRPTVKGAAQHCSTVNGLTQHWPCHLPSALGLSACLHGLPRHAIASSGCLCANASLVCKALNMIGRCCRAASTGRRRRASRRAGRPQNMESSANPCLEQVHQHLQRADRGWTTHGHSASSKAQMLLVHSLQGAAPCRALCAPCMPGPLQATPASSPRHQPHQ